MNDALDWILALVQDVDPVLRSVLAGIAMLLETSVLVGLVAPGDSVVIVASTAVAGATEYVSLLVAVVAGALAGESIGFALGRHFGPRIRVSRLGQKLGERNWIRAETYLARRGGVAIFVSRFLPVFHSLIPLTVGMSGMPYRRFMKWTVPACVLWAVAYVSVGSLAAGTYRDLSGELHHAGYFFVAAIVVFLLLVLLVKKVVQKREARHMEERVEPETDRADPNRADSDRADSNRADLKRTESGSLPLE